MRNISHLAAIACVAMALTACQTGRPGLGPSARDASISAAVETKLMTTQKANFSRVQVDCELGVVHLNGMVNSADEKARAAELAREVDGVARVRNHLLTQR